MRRTHFVISLSRSGWGEATMGMAIAKEMRRAGEDAFFLVNENLAPLLASGRVRRDAAGINRSIARGSNPGHN